MTLPLPGTYQNLRGHQQLALKQWVGHCLSGEGKVGLWVYGDHGEGSTYVASVGVKRIAREVGIENWDYSTALDLTERIRMSWTAGEVSRHNSGDYDLYVESASFEDALAEFWNVKLLWIDDLYSEQDMEFFRKHAMFRLLQRVKQGLPTVISTNMTPSSPPMSQLTKSIESWFVTCYAER